MTDGERDIIREIEADARIGEESGRIRCVFCGRSLDENEAAGDGWTFDFAMESDFGFVKIQTDAEPCRAACEICGPRHLDDFGDDPVVKPGHEIYLID